MKMGASMRGRKSWDDMSNSQKKNLSQRRSATNFIKKYYDWKAGKIERKPMFRVKNPKIDSFLISMNEEVSSFDAQSEENKRIRKEKKREAARKYYAKQARKVNKGNIYTPRGPQPSRLDREQDERIEQSIKGEVSYNSLSDEEKLKVSEEYMIVSDIKKGWRCVICKKMFTIEEEEDSTGLLREEYMYKDEKTGESIIVYYHTRCRNL